MIRSYQAGDKPHLLALLQLNTPTYFAPAERTDYEQYLAHELEDYYILEQDNQVVGAGGINYVDRGQTARISWDLLHPDYQGKGLGSQLVQHRIAHIKGKPGIHQIVVRTSQLVYPFYEKQGFQLVLTQKDYWATGYDLYQLQIDLI